MQSAKSLAAIVLSSALLATACVDPEPELGADVAELDGDEDVAASPRKCVGENESVTMGSSANQVCYLAYVSGDFNGSGEQIRVWDDGSNWKLEARASGRELYGCAECVGAQSHSIEHRWVQSGGPETMEPTATHTCFLSMIQGKLHGGGEEVRIDHGGSNWILTGASQQYGVGGNAYCFPRKASAELAWNWPLFDVQMKPVATHRCGFTMLSGRFDSTADELYINPSSTNWILGGNTNANHYLEDKGRCVFTGIVQQQPQ